MSQRRRLFAAVLVLGCLASAPSLAAAQGSLEEIREMVLYARYGDAIPALRSYLAQDGLSARQHVAALELLAIAQVANRNEADARQTLATLYARDPGHRLSDPDASPVVQSAFARARDARPSALDITLELSQTGSGGGAVVIEVRASEPADAIDEVRLSYRAEGETSWSRVAITLTDGAARARLPRAVDTAYRLSYWAEAVAPSGTAIGRLGSAGDPASLEVSASTRGPAGAVSLGQDEGPVDDDGSVFGRWWFWSIVGVVVAGGVASYFLFGPPSNDFEPGSLGTVTLR